MPRLRVSTGLSLLAAVVAVLGTLWLSQRSDRWNGPRHPVVRVHTAPARPTRTRAPHTWHAPPRVLGVGTPPLVAAPATPPTPPPLLVPVAMPPLAERYDAVRGHLDGDLVLAVTADGGGHVLDATVRRSSGDPVLDAYAQRLVRGWRFATPSGRPASFGGELPMHFDTAGTRLRSP